MSDEGGDKTEQPTGKRVSEAESKGQFAKTQEIQTVFVLTAGYLAVSKLGEHIVRTLSTSMMETIGQLGKLTLSTTSVPMYYTTFMGWLGSCVLPVMMASMIAGVIAGGLQSRFRLTFGRLEVKWEKLNPVSNLQNLFQLVPTMMRTAVGVLKLLVILGFTYLVIKQLVMHPIFYTATSFGEIMMFMVESVRSITTRVLMGLALIAAADYGYNFWKTKKDMMMTKEEVKEEAKSSEGNPHVKGEIRKRRMAILRGNWMKELPKADVVVTNPTHLAVALKYDRKSMRAPRVIAKGARLNALRIRELAQQYEIPIVENKPVARFLFKNCKIGQEIPADVYAAVAEILAYVYRVNRYRYYMESQRVTS